jgi:hypothetical protein
MTLPYDGGAISQAVSRPFLGDMWYLRWVLWHSSLLSYKVLRLPLTNTHPALQTGTTGTSEAAESTYAGSLHTQTTIAQTYTERSMSRFKTLSRVSA